MCRHLYMPREGCKKMHTKLTVVICRDLGIGAFQDKGLLHFVLWTYILHELLQECIFHFYAKLGAWSWKRRLGSSNRGSSSTDATASVFPWTCIDQNEHRLYR